MAKAVGDSSNMYMFFFVKEPPLCSGIKQISEKTALDQGDKLSLA